MVQPKDLTLEQKEKHLSEIISEKLEQDIAKDWWPQNIHINQIEKTTFFIDF